MSFSESLNTTIDKYFVETINNLDFELYDENNEGMGALKKYKNKFLKIQIINDRGYFIGDLIWKIKLN